MDGCRLFGRRALHHGAEGGKGTQAESARCHAGTSAGGCASHGEEMRCAYTSPEKTDIYQSVLEWKALIL